MNWNKHSNVEGTHALLGASNYYWLRYDEEKLRRYAVTSQATKRGTKLHEFAASCIELGQKLPKSRKTLNMYVNDCIGFKMDPEKILYFSDICYGTADAISFRDMKLRIHDLKTGTTPASMDQLMIYAALFCLEYHVDPVEIDTELRIYQNDEVAVLNPKPDELNQVIDTIIFCNDVMKQALMEQEA